MPGNCTGPTPFLCPNGTCGATQADCASASGTMPAPQGSNPPPSKNIDNPCQRFCAQWDVGCVSQRAIDCAAYNAMAPIRGPLDFLNRLWNRALGNPSFWKFTGLIGLGVVAVLIGGIIFMKE